MDALNPAVAAPASALDVAGLTAMKRLTKGDSPEGLKVAAREFEALILRTVLKSMREASPKGGPFDSDAARMYRDMADDQLALDLGRRGALGLADMIVKQVEQARVAVQAAAQRAANSSKD